MRIGEKLILSFILIILILGSAGFLGIFANKNIQKNNELSNKISAHINLLNEISLTLVKLSTVNNLEDYNLISDSVNNKLNKYNSDHLNLDVTSHGHSGDDHTHNKISKEFEILAIDIISLKNLSIISLLDFNQKYVIEKGSRHELVDVITAYEKSELNELIGVMTYYSKEALFQYQSEEKSDLWVKSIQNVKDNLLIVNATPSAIESIKTSLDDYTVLASDISGIVIDKKSYDNIIQRKILLLQDLTLEIEGFRKVALEGIIIKTKTKNTQIITFFGILIFGSIIFSLFFGYSIAKSISNPAQKLVEVAKEIGKGNFSIKTNLKTKDEFGELSAAFDSMEEGLSAESRLILKKTDELRLKKMDLEQAYEELKKLDESKDNFLSAVSHELRTPLTAMKSYNQLL